MNRFTYIFSSTIFFVFCAASVQSQILTEIYCGHLLNVESGVWARNALIKVDRNSGKIEKVTNYAKVSSDLSKDNLDLSDQYCLPGLIDMHTHISEDVSGDLIEFYSISQEEQLKIGRKNAHNQQQAF